MALGASWGCDFLQGHWCGGPLARGALGRALIGALSRGVLANGGVAGLLAWRGAALGPGRPLARQGPWSGKALGPARRLARQGPWPGLAQTRCLARKALGPWRQALPLVRQLARQALGPARPLAPAPSTQTPPFFGGGAWPGPKKRLSGPLASLLVIQLPGTRRPPGGGARQTLNLKP